MWTNKTRGKYNTCEAWSRIVIAFSASLLLLIFFSSALTIADRYTALALRPPFPINITMAVQLNSQGDTLSKQGNFTEAMRYYNKALAIDPKNVGALSGIGDTLSKQGNFTEAMRYYNKALAIDPLFTWVHITSDIYQF